MTITAASLWNRNITLYQWTINSDGVVTGEYVVITVIFVTSDKLIPVSNDTVNNCSPVIVTGDKFITGITENLGQGAIASDEKFIADVVDTSDKH